MAYDVSSHLRYAQPVTAFNEARQRRFQNALATNQDVRAEADQRMQQESYQNALTRQQTTDQQEAEARDLAQQKARHDLVISEISPFMQRVLKEKDPKTAFLSAIANPQVMETFKMAGFDENDFDPNDPELEQDMRAIAALSSPVAPPKQFKRVEGPRGSILQEDPETGEIRQVVGPDNSQSAPPRSGPKFRPATAAEIRDYGLPEGTAAQIDLETGKLDVISKRDNTANLSQKDMTTARMKLNTIKLAKQQIANIKEKFKGIKGSFSAGIGGQIVPSKGGMAFDAAVDQMRSTLTALTRVPGVGAMSDYETKLDQAKFPKRGTYEDVTQQQIQGIEDMLATIETGYTDLLGSAQQAPAATPPQGETAAQRAKRLGL